MPLFPKQEGADELADAPSRMLWTRELGTRKMVLSFVALIVVLGIGWYIRDLLLLGKHWTTLKADPDGLTVVGTLDSRDSYESNLFRVVQVEGQSRAELTSWGWESIFKESHGKLCGDQYGRIIRGVIDVDSEIGYAMLEPYLEAAAKKEMNLPDAFAAISRETSLSFPDRADQHGFPKQKTLGALFDYYRNEGREFIRSEPAESEGGSGSGHDVDHGLTIPGETLIHTCPIVLTGQNFSGGWVQTHPASILGGKTYTVHLELTPEGRSRFYQWSRHHAHENLVFVLKKQVVTAGRIAQIMDVDNYEITNLKDPEAARSLVDYVKQQSSRLH